MLPTSKCPQHFTHALMFLVEEIHTDNLVPETVYHFAAHTLQFVFFELTQYSICLK
jgi:hypothetical protein